MSNLGLMHEIRIYFCFMLCLILDLFILLSLLQDLHLILAFEEIVPLQPPTDNITELTDRSIDAIVEDFDLSYETRLIDDTNITKYKIDREPAGAFTYVEDEKDLNYTEPVPFVASEVVVTIHNGYGYSFYFCASRKF